MEWSIGAEVCAAERSGGLRSGAERSIGAEELPHYGVEQIRGRIGASECRISAVDRSGAEWSIGTSERRVAAPEHHQAELIQLHEYKSTCGLVQAPERSIGAGTFTRTRSALTLPKQPPPVTYLMPRKWHNTKR